MVCTHDGRVDRHGEYTVGRIDPCAVGGDGQQPAVAVRLGKRIAYGCRFRTGRVIHIPFGQHECRLTRFRARQPHVAVIFQCRRQTAELQLEGIAVRSAARRAENDIFLQRPAVQTVFNIGMFKDVTVNYAGAEVFQRQRVIGRRSRRIQACLPRFGGAYQRQPNAPLLRLDADELTGRRIGCEPYTEVARRVFVSRAVLPVRIGQTIVIILPCTVFPIMNGAGP